MRPLRHEAGTLAASAAVLFVGALAIVLLTPSAARASDTPPASGPQGPTSAELVEYAQRWDGREIDFTGEVIAEAQERGEYAWIHVNDDAYARRSGDEPRRRGGYNSGQAVWLPTALTEPIRFYGDHRHEGDVVNLRGTFNAACAQHGGDMDIHATSLRIETVGREALDPVKPVKLVVGLVLAAIAAGLWAAIRRAENRELLGVFGR